MTPQRGIGENTRRAYFHQIAREFVFEDPVFVAAEVNGVLDAEYVEIVSAGIFAIEPYAAIALDATIHLVEEERAEVLVAKRPLLKPRAAIVVAGHDCHVLEMAFPTDVAYRAIVRMVQHHAFDNVRAESGNFRIVNGNPRLLLGRRHARHHDFALDVLFVLLVLELFDGALAARAHGTQSGMPAEVRQVESQRETRVQQVLLRVCFIGLAVDVNGSHQVRPITFGNYTAARVCAIQNRLGNTSARSLKAPPHPVPTRKTCGLFPKTWSEISGFPNLQP